MYQQIFLPVNKGLMTSAPSSLIPDGASSACNNVRFDDGFVEKVRGFIEYKTIEDGSPIIAINQYISNDSLPKNIVHTPSGMYWVRDEIDDYSEANLIPASDQYQLSEFGHLSTDCAFGEYYFCGLGTDVYYWNGSDPTAKRLGGLINAEEWTQNHYYNVGDIVKPKAKYSGYIYVCTSEGTSGSSEYKTVEGQQVSIWEKNLTTEISDGTCRWIGYGSDQVDGNSAKSVQAQCIGDYKGFLFVANTVEDGNSYPTRLRWSQWQNPRLWHNNEDGSGLAGYVDVNDTVGEIRAIKKIGDILAVYKEDGIVAISYTGGDTVYSKELITTKAGLLSPQALVVLPHSHIFVGRDNIYEFDGNSVVPIGNDIKKYFFEDLKSKNKIIGYFNPESKDIIFAYDNSSQNSATLSKAIVLNSITRAWSIRDLNVTSLGDFVDTPDVLIDEMENYVFDSKEMNNLTIDSSLYKVQTSIVVGGTTDGRLYRLKGNADSRGDYDGYFVSKTHHMDDPSHIKRLLRIQIHAEEQPEADMYVQVMPLWNPEIVESDIRWEDAPEYIYKFRRSDAERPVAPPYVDMDLSARYFKIRFGTRKNNEYFKVLGYTLFYETRGDI